MKIKYEENDKLSYHEVSIGYHPRNKEIVHLLTKTFDKVIGEMEVFDEYHNYYSISVLSIYYIEIVDHKVFVYTKDKVFRKNDTLGNLKALLKYCDFFQINVRTLVNKNHITHYKVGNDCRRILYLDNDEKLVVNRRFRDVLKDSMNQ